MPMVQMSSWEEKSNWMRATSAAGARANGVVAQPAKFCLWHPGETAWFMCNVVPDVTAETLLGLTVKKVHRGSIVTP